jgi:hypothetical protein
MKPEDRLQRPWEQWLQQEEANMKSLTVVLAAFVLCLASGERTARGQQPETQAGAMELPAGTKVELAVIAPVWTRSAKGGRSALRADDLPCSSRWRLSNSAGHLCSGQNRSRDRSHPAKAARRDSGPLHQNHLRQRIYDCPARRARGHAVARSLRSPQAPMWKAL